MRNHLKYLLVLCFLILSTSYSICEAAPIYVVTDTQGNSPDIKHWRVSQPYSVIKENKKSVVPFWVSGSAVPSVNGWKAIKKNILAMTNHQVKTIIDVDLRQESHGYLNSNAIELEAPTNWGNLGKTRAQVLKDEQKWLSQLKQQSQLDDVLTAKQYKSAHYSKGHTIVVKTVENEQTTVEKLGLKYFRLTVPDHMAPSNADVDRFIALVRDLKPKTWLHIHCRGGDGRTTTFMAMYDMLTNIKQFSYSDIVVRQASIVPYYNLLKSSRHYARTFAVRIKFLEKFYAYTEAYSKGYSGNWSQWLALQK